jgi:hypothetical protein
MSINLVARLKKLESKLSSQSVINRGYKYFYTFDDHTYYYRSTSPVGAISPIKATLINYRDACRGCDGKADPNDKAFTREEVEELGREGWRCLVIKWISIN